MVVHLDATWWHICIAATRPRQVGGFGQTRSECPRAESQDRPSDTLKQFCGDRGFGDCPMHIKYVFRTADERSVLGKFAATESSFHGIDAGDQIAIRYIAKHPYISAPEDSLSIVRPIQKSEDVRQDSE